MRFWCTFGVQMGFGIAVWPSGAEIFIGPLMIRLIFYDRKLENKIHRFLRMFRRKEE